LVSFLNRGRHGLARILNHKYLLPKAQVVLCSWFVVHRIYAVFAVFPPMSPVFPRFPPEIPLILALDVRQILVFIREIEFFVK
jgi:hypothetical protein